MPQMAPISWLLLFIFFNMIFFMFNMMNYFFYAPSNTSQSQLNFISSNSMTWKW